jgi:hypothetical protein
VNGRALLGGPSTSPLDVGAFMRPSQVFGVVVRSFGLLSWVGSVAYIASALTVFLTPTYRPDALHWSHYLAAAVFWFLVGWLLLRKADRFVAFAYRLGSSDATDV